MNVDDEKFDFEAFEHLRGLPSNGAAFAARDFLLKKFPKGSDAYVAAKYVEAGGAKCKFAKDRQETMYFCVYTRPNHGLMALVSSIEWTVIILTDPGGIKINGFTVGREALGP